MRKFPTRKLLAAVVAGALFLPETAFTLGLGEIEVSSSLNQKLKADIELLSAAPEDIESLIVKLASRKEFSRAGLDRPYLLNDLRFKSEVIDGVPHVIVSSGSPIREPFLNFLVEIDWPNGHLLREYTVLLDPPVFMTQPASAAAALVNQSNTANSDSRPASNKSRASGGANIVPIVTPSVTSSPKSETSDVAQASAQANAPANNTTFVPAPPISYGQQQTSTDLPPGSYRIKTGDTTWSLANAMMPDQSISVEQMMIAMLRENPESFINGNINGLKRGYILRVPDYEQIVAINSGDARALVREQATLWRQYQLANAGGQPASAMPADGATTSTDDDMAVASEENAYLEIVSAGSGASSASAKDPTDMTSQELRAELALTRERVETERVEKEALQQQVNNLEQNVDKMKGMLSIEDNELSDVQALGQQSEIEAAAEPTEIVPTEIVPTEIEPTQGEILEPDLVDDAAAEMTESSAETDDLLTEQTFEDVLAEGTEDEEAVFTDEATGDELAEAAENTESVQEEAIAENVVIEDAAVPPSQLAAAPSTDPLSRLLSDPILLAAAGGGLLLVLAVIGLIIKRRKAAAEAESFELSAFDDEADDAIVELIADKAGDVDVAEQANDFDSDATMILDGAENTIVTDEGENTAVSDDEPRDDIIAEADVYLAYGIYQQAEELLTQAIADNPERNDYRIKLAETLYASKNGKAFVEVAVEIKKRVSDELTPEWKKIMAMGQDLCGDNPLFQGSMVGGIAVDSMEAKAPEMDFDLGIDGNSADNSASELDLDIDNQSLDLPEMESEEPASELEFDISDAGAAEETLASEDEFSLDIDASELDIDAQDEAAITKEGDDIHDLDFGLDEVTSDESAEEMVVEEEIAIDLTDDADALGLDLDDDNSAAETLVSSDDLSDDDSFDLSSLDDVDEVSTKLDLARAYLDMGDNEGTRGILKEVIEEGNDEQKKEANELMAKLV
ncbi:hypothetical protein MNBD_GAMMA06-1074 [hydrothermal vent metagenome]|uniref:FimV N-terminal domain-containing protein n=1 Tax=hydrothermal vent metagenome TaxID=652676 RepID=A0A3B0W7F8_9ZZZZ